MNTPRDVEPGTGGHLGERSRLVGGDAGPVLPAVHLDEHAGVRTGGPRGPGRRSTESTPIVSETVLASARMRSPLAASTHSG